MGVRRGWGHYRCRAMIVGFLGSGNMAAGMARGWAAGGSPSPQRMLFSDAGSGRAVALAAEVGGEAVGSNAELAEASDLLILAVKPKDLEAVAAEAQGAPAVLSMLGATPVARVAAAFPGAAVMRLMPNLGVEVRRGVMCFAAGAALDPAIVASVLDALRLLGRVEVMDDGMIDAATAVMGCTPAYLALVAAALAGAGAEAGLDPALAASLLPDTMEGTAELLRVRPADELIAAVASPGGSTEAGLGVLAERGVREALAAAVRASLERMAAA